MEPAEKVAAQERMKAGRARSKRYGGRCPNKSQRHMAATEARWKVSTLTENPVKLATRSVHLPACRVEPSRRSRKLCCPLFFSRGRLRVGHLDWSSFGEFQNLSVEFLVDDQNVVPALRLAHGEFATPPPRSRCLSTAFNALAYLLPSDGDGCHGAETKGGSLPGILSSVLVVGLWGPEIPSHSPA